MVTPREKIRVASFWTVKQNMHQSLAAIYSGEPGEEKYENEGCQNWGHNKWLKRHSGGH
jgi:hypothetical protein